MRGDRPTLFRSTWTATRFTPHARGSTCNFHLRLGSPLVYPACAGIDLASLLTMFNSKSLPRMRGDRPIQYKTYSLPSSFTPHARGST